MSKSFNYQRFWRQFKVYMIFAVAVLAFGIMGMFQGDNSFSGSGSAATVNGQVITMIDFDRQFQRLQADMGGFINQLPQEQQKMYLSNFRKRALEQLIQKEVMVQSAKELGIEAADEDVVDQIVEIKAFQNNNGVFDRMRYKTVLDQNRISIANFEKDVEQDLRRQKLLSIFQSAFLSVPLESELNDTLKNTKLNLEYVAVNKAIIQDKNKATPAKVKSFVSKNKSDIQKYFDENKSEFKKKEEVNARHILIKASKEEEFEKALEKINKIKKEITDSNFAELAKKYSEDKGSAIKGGSLGFFGRGRMVKPFEDVAFKLEVNKVSEPVKSNFGYHIIKVEAKRGGELPQLSTVEKEIAEKLMGKSLAENAMEELKSYYNEESKTVDVNGVKSFLKKYNLKTEETGDFDLSQLNIPKIGDDERFMDEALSLKQENAYFKKMIANNGKSYIIKLKKFQMTNKDGAKAEKESPKFTNFRYGYSFQKWIDAQKENFNVKTNANLMQ